MEVYLVDDTGALIHPETIEDGAELTQLQVATPPPPEARAPQWDFTQHEWRETADPPDYCINVTPDALPDANKLATQLAQTNADFQAFMDYFFATNPE